MIRGENRKSALAAVIRRFLTSTITVGDYSPITKSKTPADRRKAAPVNRGDRPARLRQGACYRRPSGPRSTYPRGRGILQSMDAPKLEATRRRFRIKIDDLIWHPAERGALYTNVYNTHKPARSSLRQAQRQARVPPAGSTPPPMGSWVSRSGRGTISNRLRTRRFKGFAGGEVSPPAPRHQRKQRQ